jgi:hypothetical protein
MEIVIYHLGDACSVPLLIFAFIDIDTKSQNSNSGFSANRAGWP